METVESINSEKPRFAGFAARWAEILNSVIFWGLMVVIVVTLIPVALLYRLVRRYELGS